MDLSAFKEFNRYVEKEIEPAIADLRNLEEKNRVHVQKLVYTNLVDRFDTLVDSTILGNCREEGFADLALAGLSGNVTESDLIKVLMQGENLQGALDDKLKNGLRNMVLKKRHSQKLANLFSTLQPDLNATGAQRVNVPTGRIMEKVTSQGNGKIPCSICGYADWLYSRRNAVVHGGGNSRLLENDRRQLKKLYKKAPAATFKISLGSVSNAVAFYKDVISELDA